MYTCIYIYIYPIYVCICRLYFHLIYDSILYIYAFLCVCIGVYLYLMAKRWELVLSLEKILFSKFIFYFCLFAISWASPAAHGGSQARGRIGAVATSLCQSHSNTGSQPCLRPTPQLTAMQDL